MPPKDTSNIVLSIWAGNQLATDAFGFKHNKHLLVKTGEPAPKKVESNVRSKRQPTPDFSSPSQTEIVLRTDHGPKDFTRGWRLGSDPEECDCLLDRNNLRGVSGVHFEINHNWDTFSVVITNKSNNLLTIRLPKQGPDPFGQGQKRALPREPCIILLDVGLLRFMLQVPEREDEDAYISNLRAYGDKAQMEMPSISRMNFRKRGNPTPAIATHRYIPEDKVGSGAHGEVRSATDGYSGDRVALKTFNLNFKSDEIEWEVHIHKPLDHCNIIHFIDYVPLDRLIVLEYAAYGTLSDQDPDVSRAQLYHLAIQMTSALSYLHAKEITHRDVKPANILVCDLEPIVGKLCDFSVATTVQPPSGYCGTDMYRAPEVPDMGQTPYSSLIDIFSLGVVVIERWYDWYPEFVYGLSIQGDTFLPDTMEDDDATRNITKMRARAELGDRSVWSNELRDKWINLVRSKLDEQITGPTESCHIAELFLRMFQPDPKKRWPAKVCHSYLKKQREDYPVATKPEPLKPPAQVTNTAHPQFKKSRRSHHTSEETKAMGKTPVAQPPVSTARICLRPSDCLVSAEDLWKASSKRSWPKAAILLPYKTISKHAQSANGRTRKAGSNRKEFLTYADGLELASQLELRKLH